MALHEAEVAAHLERADVSLKASQTLAQGGYYDIAASRAYYAAFYAASAILLQEGVDVSKHSGVIALIHQRYVKTGKLSKEMGKGLNWLFELRAVGDYGITAHVSEEEAELAIQTAESLVVAIKALVR